MSIVARCFTALVAAALTLVVSAAVHAASHDLNETIPRYALHTHRYQAGLRVRVWRGLSVSGGTSYQGGQPTQNRRTAIDAGLSYAVRKPL